MRRVTSIGLALLFALTLPCSAPTEAQRGTTAASPLELRVSGPRLIHRGDTLKFTATLTNRSDKPIALRFPHFVFDDPTQFNWRVTNAGGHLLPPHIYDGPPIFICPVVGPVSDLAIHVLEPGEAIDYENIGDPSDDFKFTGKGFYRVTLTYILAPISDSQVEVSRFRPPDEQPGKYTPQQKIEMLKNMPRMEVTSNEWHMYLTD